MELVTLLIKGLALATLATLAILCWPITLLVLIVAHSKHKSDNRTTEDAP